MIGETNIEKTFCVYIHTNKINGKRYVGVTSQPPERRWENGKGYTKRQPHIYNAIKKWGWDNFEHEILITNVSLEHADSLERMLIKAWRLQNPQYGYNAQSGGLINAALSEDIRKKQSEAHIGIKFTEEHKKNLSNARKNRPLSEKQKKHLEKIQNLNRGREFTKEHRQNLSEALKGREFSEEHKRNISNGKKGKPQSDAQKLALETIQELNKGRRHTEESKAKISAGNKGKVVSQESREKMSVAKKGKIPKCSQPKRVGQYDINTGCLIQEFDSVVSASKFIGTDNSYFGKCIKNNKPLSGFNWKFI